MVEQNRSDNKRQKVMASNENLETETDGDGNSHKVAEQPAKLVEPPKQDYIHVRARRGEATDSHSLAERVINLTLTLAYTSLSLGESVLYIT